MARVREMSEAELQETILQLCAMMRVKVFHVFDSRRSEDGWPDLTLVGRHGVLFRELKGPRGVVSPDQERWIAALREAGQHAGVWRPVDWTSGLITREIRELAGPSSWPGPSERTLRRRAERKVRARAGR